MEPRDLLDPDIAAGVAQMPDAALDTAMLGAIRSFSLEVPLSDAVTRTDHLVPGEPEVPVRVHRARDAEGPFPCLFSIHGGGYVVGSYTMDDPPRLPAGSRVRDRPAGPARRRGLAGPADPPPMMAA
jgi:acetyl esterase/lipase